MTLSDTELKSILLQDDIFPLGNFETLPVTHLRDGKVQSYPLVAMIYNNIDHKGLLEEALKHIEIVGNNYVKNRINALNKSVGEQDLRDILGHVGFEKGSYQSYSLRKLGTSELEDWVLPKTRSFFDNLPVKTFRQQYAVAFPGWNTKLHRDHKDFLIHGFRAMVPLSADVYMGYESQTGENLIFKLARGGMYFVNIAAMHRGFNESETKDRINLIMQMDSDQLVVNATQLKQLSELEISILPSYAKEYEHWRLGDEL